MLHSDKKYVSCIKVNGQPILPPLMTPEISKEMQKYKEQALQIENRLKQNKAVTKDKTHTEYKNTQSIELTLDNNNCDLAKDLNNFNAKQVANSEQIDVNLSHLQSKISSTCDEIKEIFKTISDVDTTFNNNNQTHTVTERNITIEKLNNLLDFNENDDCVSKSTIECYTTDEDSISISKKLGKSPKSGNGAGDRLIETPKIPRLIRQNSYVLESPSPIFLAYLENQTKRSAKSATQSCPKKVLTTSINNRYTTEHRRRSCWDLTSAKEKWSSFETNIDFAFIPTRVNPKLVKSKVMRTKSASLPPSPSPSPTKMLEVSMEQKKSNIHYISAGVSSKIKKSKSDKLEKHIEPEIISLNSTTFTTLSDDSALNHKEITRRSALDMDQNTTRSIDSGVMTLTDLNSDQRSTEDYSNKDSIITVLNIPKTDLQTLDFNYTNSDHNLVTYQTLKMTTSTLSVDDSNSDQCTVIEKQNICRDLTSKHSLINPLDINLDDNQSTVVTNQSKIDSSIKKGSQLEIKPDIVSHKHSPRSNNSYSDQLSLNLLADQKFKFEQRAREIYQTIQKEHSKQMAELIQRQKREQEILMKHLKDQEMEILEQLKHNYLENALEIVNDQESNDNFSDISSETIQLITSRSNSISEKNFPSPNESSSAGIESVNVHSVYSSRCSRELFPKIPQTEVNINAVVKIQAAIRGYLVRRLLQTERVCTLIKTIKDTLICALQFHNEKVDNIEMADVELHKRLIQQLTGACHAIHDIFFNLSLKERMSIIALDRQRLKEKMLRPSSGRISVSPGLTATTQKIIQRKLQQSHTSPTRPARLGQQCCSKLATRINASRINSTTGAKFRNFM